MQMLDKQHRIVTLTNNTLHQSGYKRNSQGKKEPVFTPVGHEYAEVLIPYYSKELANRKPGNTKTHHVVVMKRSNLSKITNVGI